MYLVPKNKSQTLVVVSLRMNIGIDEAGRGPLAGPVWIGAAVILDEVLDLSAFGDSKMMTERQRASAYGLIQKYAHE